MTTAKIEGYNLIKRICVNEIIDIPADAKTDERFRLGREAKERLKESVLEAIIPYIEFDAYTPEGGKFKTSARLMILDLTEMEGEREE